MKNIRKAGAASATTIGMMAILLLMITAMFTYTMNNTLLVSRTLDYTHGYNEASMAIDNARDLIKKELNALTNEERTVSEATDLTRYTEKIYDVTINISNTENNDGYLTSLTVEISKSFGNKIMYATVKFSSEDGALIKDELLDHDSIAIGSGESNMDYKTSFRTSDMLLAYWEEQFRNSIDFETDNNYNIITWPEDKKPKLKSGENVNKLIEAAFQKDPNLLTNWANTYRNARNANTNEQRCKIMYNILSAFENSIQNYASGLGGWRRFNSGDLLQNKRGTYTITNSMAIEGGINYYNDTAVTKLVIKNNSIVYVRGNLITDIDIEIEKGSTLFVTGDIRFTSHPEGKRYPLVSIGRAITLWETETMYDLNKSVDINTSKDTGSRYVGSGLCCMGNFKYKCNRNFGQLDIDSYVHDSNDKMTGPLFVGGGQQHNDLDIEIEGSPAFELNIPDIVSILFGIGNTITYTGQFCNFGMTIYGMSDITLSYVAFEPTRPAFVLTQGKTTMKYCKAGERNNVKGLAFFVIGDVEYIYNSSQTRNALKANFYLWIHDASSIEYLQNLVNKWNNDTQGLLSGVGYNDFVTKEDLSPVIGGINNWYLPPLLKGEVKMIAFSTPKDPR